VLIDAGARVWVVGPRTELVAGTVAEDIAYGTAATREQMVGASKGAGSHSFVSELPEHYDTLLGAGGVGLSGGQRQRIGIARALLCDPTIVVVEEPTSGLDPLSEARVVEGLSVLMRGRTTILITRSPAIAGIADRVVVFENGRMVKDGPPRSLFEHPARRPSAPFEDPALPAVGLLLDAEAMAEVLQRGMVPGAPFPDVRVKYLRYKPGTNLVALYNVGVGGSGHDVVARIATGASMAKRASTGTSPPRSCAAPRSRSATSTTIGRSVCAR
jgi:energy-coupling factor transporter ATP-binding protein EcfA2